MSPRDTSEDKTAGSSSAPPQRPVKRQQLSLELHIPALGAQLERKPVVSRQSLRLPGIVWPPLIRLRCLQSLQRSPAATALWRASSARSMRFTTIASICMAIYSASRSSTDSVRPSSLSPPAVQCTDPVLDPLSRRVHHFQSPQGRRDRAAELLSGLPKLYRQRSRRPPGALGTLSATMRASGARASWRGSARRCTGSQLSPSRVPPPSALPHFHDHSATRFKRCLGRRLRWS
jgi:hypothetical protein